MPKPENTPGRPDHAGAPGDDAPGRDRPLDPATGRKEHPHGQPPGQANRPPKEDRPDDGDDGGDEHADPHAGGGTAGDTGAA